MNIGICRRFPIKIQYIFLGHNRSYLFVNVDRWIGKKKQTYGPCLPLIPLCVLKICCFTKLGMNRKKRNTAIMPFILNREYKFFIPKKKSTVLQILFNCLKCYNVTQCHSRKIFRSVGQEKMALGLWRSVEWFWFCFEDIFPGISIQPSSVIYFSVVSDVNLLLLTSCKKLNSVFQVCLLRNFFSLNIHIVYTLFFFFWKFA